MTNYRNILLLLLLLPTVIFAQREKPCSTLYKSSYEEKVDVNGMIVDTVNCDCNLCETQPKSNRQYSIKGARYCEKKIVGFGKLDDTKELRGRCVVFEASQLVSYRNDFFITLDANYITYLTNGKFQNNYLIAMQGGYYFRNKVLKTHEGKIRLFQPSYSVNIKQGLTIDYSSKTNPKYSPFLGIDFSLNIFIRGTNSFVSYSSGYSIVQLNNSNHLYYSIGYNFLLL